MASLRQQPAIATIGRLYSAGHHDRFRRADAHDRACLLCDSNAQIEENTVCDAHGILLLEPRDQSILHCVQRIDVVC